MRAILLSLGVLSGMAFGKSPMLNGTFRMGEGDEAFRIRFVTVNVPGTATRVASCTAVDCERSTKVTAYCPELGRDCEFLRDIVILTQKYLGLQNGHDRWQVLYGAANRWGTLSTFGELEAGTFGEDPKWRFRGEFVPLVRE